MNRIADSKHLQLAAESFGGTLPETLHGGRQTLMEKLTPVEQAMFSVAESLLRFEHEFNVRPERAGDQIVVRWKHRLSTAELLRESIEEQSFPLKLDGKRTEVFHWEIYPAQPQDEFAEITRLGGYTKFQDEYGARGGPEIRIYIVEQDGRYSLKLYANLGRFSPMEKELREVLDRVDFPIVASDREGYDFYNKAWQRENEAAAP